MNKTMIETMNETTIGAVEVMLAPEHKGPRMLEVPELRGENHKVFHLNSKEQQAVFYPSPVHVFNEETQMFEEAADILTEEEDSKRFASRRNHFAASFCKEKESNQLFTVESGEHKVTVFTKPEKETGNDAKDNSNSTKGVHIGKVIVPTKVQKQQLGKKKDVITFADVKAGTDYEYSVAGYGVKENIIVKEKAKDYRYAFYLQCEHVTPELEEVENRIAFFSNKTGKEVFYIPAPFMTDANGVVSADVTYELTENPKGVYVLTVTADSEWMNATERVFPVTIDPQINLSGSESMTTYSWKSGGLVNGSLHAIGHTVDANGNRSANRMYMELTIPALPHNPRIKKAELSFAQNAISLAGEAYPKLGLYAVDDDFRLGYYTPAYSEDLIDFAAMKTGTGAEGEIVRYTFDVTTLVDEIAKGEISSRKLVLKLIDENVIDNNSITLCGSSYEEDYAPQFVVTYESSYGVNSSYRTHSHALGSFGQGSIDLACGNLMFDFSDFAWSGIRMPVTLRHLYNSALSDYVYTYNPSIGLNISDFSSMKVGHGFKLNLMQSMRPVTFVHEGETCEGYVYTDENGVENYFKLKSDSLYENVDDGDMIYDQNEHTLECGDKILKFDEAGRLLSIVDSFGNKMELTYTNGRITSVCDGAGRSFALSYDSNGFLTDIAAPDETSVSYTYSGELLSSITAQDGRKAIISYAENLPSEVTLYDADGNGVYKMDYTFEGDRLTSATEYAKKAEETVWKKGVSNAYAYSAASSSTVVLTTEPKDAEEGEETDTVTRTVYTFDDEGDIVSEYSYLQDMENTSEEGEGTSIHPYAGAGVISESINLLKHHSFETLDNWTGMSGNGENFVMEQTESESSAKFGKKALRMQTYNAQDLANGVYQTVENLPAGSYTFSTYLRPIVNFSGEDAKGAYLRVATVDGVILAESEHLADYETEYNRLVAPFELASTQTVNVQILLNGRGVIYADAAQLEDKPYASPYNLLENGTFEYPVFDYKDGWIGITSENNTDEEVFDGNYSIKTSGNLNMVSFVYQKVDVRASRSTRESFTLSGWAKGYGLPNHERENVANAPQFRLRAEIHYDDNEEEKVETHTADFSPCTEEWQYVSLDFAKSKYRKVKFLRVYCDYGYNTGTAYFDNIQLVRTDLETGLSASDFVVEDTSDFEEETEESTATPSAPTFAEAQDAYGNALTETVFSDGEFGTIYRSFGYTPDDNEDGTENPGAGNNLIRETDARGNVTTYLVDEETSRNKEVIDRCGNKTSYEYDETGRTTKVTSEKPQYNENGEKVTDTDGEVIYDEVAKVTYNYDSFDNMTEIVRGDGMKYALGYNAFHNLESIGVDGKEESLVKYTYKNGNGRLKAITYANGHTMKASYNSAGQMTSEKWYATEAEASSQDAAPMAHYKYVYDGQGNIVRSIDVLGEKEYNYSYEDGSLVRATESDITLSGEIVTTKMVVHTICYYYDSEGQMTRKRISPAEGTAQVIYYENTEDNTAVKFYAGGQYVTSHSKSDEFGRKVFDELQLGTGFVSRQFSYHTGEATEEHIENKKLKSSPTTQLVSNITFSDGRTLSYEYDEEERITKVIDKFNGEETITEYIYDALGQLLTEKVDGEVVNAMTYDNYGNIVSKNGVAYTYGNTAWKDLLTGYGDKTITYDAQGNPVNYLGHTLTWEKGRQLKKFTKADGTVINYTYNANGIRTSKTVNGVKHTYTLDGTKILCETWVKDGVNHSIVPMYDNEDSVCGVQYNGEPYYFQKNLQGDIIAIVDKDANTVARYTYDAWGVCTITEDVSGCGIVEVNPYRYRGYYFDAEIAMYYLQSRYYDAEIGRFVNTDNPGVMVFVDSLNCNLCAYCDNNVVSDCDYSGYASFRTKSKSLNKLIEVLEKSIPNIYTEDFWCKEVKLLRIGTTNLNLTISVGVAAQTNKNALFGGIFKKGTLEVSSFFGVNSAVCFGFSAGVTCARSYIKVGLLVAMSRAAAGFYGGAYVEISVPTWILAMATVAVGVACIYNPAVGAYIAKFIGCIKSSIRVAAEVLVRIFPYIVKAAL